MSYVTHLCCTLYCMTMAGCWFLSQCSLMRSLWATLSMFLPSFLPSFSSHTVVDAAWQWGEKKLGCRNTRGDMSRCQYLYFLQYSPHSLTPPLLSLSPSLTTIITSYYSNHLSYPLIITIINITTTLTFASILQTCFTESLTPYCMLEIHYKSINKIYLLIQVCFITDREQHNCLQAKSKKVAYTAVLHLLGFLAL